MKDNARIYTVINDTCNAFEKNENEEAYRQLQLLIKELNQLVIDNKDIEPDELNGILRDALNALEQQNIDALIDILKYGLTDVLDGIC